MTQDFGKFATTRDLPGGAVEITEPLNAFENLVWRYYPSEASCLASLPRAQPIPKRYE